MRAGASTRVIAILLPAIAAGTAILPAQDPSPTRPRTLIAGARILDAAAGTYLPPSFVLVEGRRITSVGTERPAAVLEDTETIDGKGLTLVPGLVDAHAQVSPANDLDADYFALMSLAHGVTAVRGVNVRTTWGVAQRRRLVSGQSFGPRLFTSGRGIDRAARPDLWLFDAPSAAAAGQEARRQAEAGVDWVAGYGHVSADMYRAMVAAVSGTAARVAAFPGSTSVSDLAAAGVHSIETLDYPTRGLQPGSVAGSTDSRWPALAAREAASLARALVKSNVTLVPLLAQSLLQAYPQEVAADPDLAKLPGPRREKILAAAKGIRWPETAARRKDWAARSAFLGRFIAAGGRVAAGTGFEEAGYPVPGAGLHTEMAALVRAGLAPADAIRAATINGTALLNASNEIGAVKPGMAADLILVEGDPLASVGDLARIVRVIRAGEVFDPQALLDRALKARGPAR